MKSAKEIWGTVISLDVRDAIDEDTIDTLWAWFQRVDDLFSTWRDDSEISRIARGELAVAEASPEIPLVLELCEQMRATSDGAFDIAYASDAPMDPTGLVKGWAVDRAADLLGAAGASNFSINAGGDVLVRGRPEPCAVWRIGIQHPWQRDKTAATVCVTDRAVATSGNYERGDHVINPRTGRPAVGLVSVTVIASTLTSADGCATAALALGPDGMAWLATLPDVAAMGITDDQRVVKTAAFDRFVA